MNWNVIEQHRAELEIIADASVPNKDQNRAVKNLIHIAVNTLSNRIAEGWLDDKMSETPLAAVSQVPGPPSIKGTVLYGDDGRIVGVSDGSKVLGVEQAA